MNYDKLKKYLYILLKISWVSLYVYLSVKLSTNKGEYALGYAINILLITFPSSILSAAFIYLIIILFGLFSYTEIIIQIILFFFGYYQWFILTPKIIKKMKEKSKLKEMQLIEQTKKNIEKYNKDKEDYAKSLIMKGYTNEAVKYKISNYTDEDINKLRDIILNKQEEVK